MELIEEQKILFKLLNRKGFKKHEAIGIMVEIAESGKSCDMLISWILNNKNSNRDDIYDILDKMYYSSKIKY